MAHQLRDELLQGLWEQQQQQQNQNNNENEDDDNNNNNNNNDPPAAVNNNNEDDDDDDDDENDDDDDNQGDEDGILDGGVAGDHDNGRSSSECDIVSFLRRTQYWFYRVRFSRNRKHGHFLLYKVN
jgi:hypothetical protein